MRKCLNLLFVLFFGFFPLSISPLTLFSGNKFYSFSEMIENDLLKDWDSWAEAHHFCEEWIEILKKLDRKN